MYKLTLKITLIISLLLYSAGQGYALRPMAAAKRKITFKKATEIAKRLTSSYDFDSPFKKDILTLAEHIDNLGIKAGQRVIEIGPGNNWVASLLFILYGCEVDVVQPDSKHLEDILERVTLECREFYKDEPLLAKEAISRIHIYPQYLRDFLKAKPSNKYTIVVAINVLDQLVKINTDDMRLLWQSLEKNTIMIISMIGDRLGDLKTSAQQAGLELAVNNAPAAFSALKGKFNYTVFVKNPSHPKIGLSHKTEALLKKLDALDINYQLITQIDEEWDYSRKLAEYRKQLGGTSIYFTNIPKTLVYQGKKEKKGSVSYISFVLPCNMFLTKGIREDETLVLSLKDSFLFKSLRLIDDEEVFRSVTGYEPGFASPIPLGSTKQKVVFASEFIRESEETVMIIPCGTKSARIALKFNDLKRFVESEGHEVEVAPIVDEERSPEDFYLETKFSSAGGDNSQAVAKEQILHDVAMLTRNIFKEEKEEGRPRGGRICQMHAILLNYILNRVGIKSRIIALDYRWLERRWEGLHYCVETEDNVYIDAFPEGVFINANIDSEIVMLFPGEDRHDEYTKSKELAASRDWGSIAPENLLKKEYYVTVLEELTSTYSERIERLIKEHGQAQAMGHLSPLVTVAINAAA